MRRAITRGPFDLRIEHVEAPALVSGQVRVSVDVVGLCGSDYHLYSGRHPYAHYPQTQGHEYAGTVAQLPKDYRGPLRVGDAVVGEPFRACGKCFACRRGRPNCCADLVVMGAHIAGALAEEVVVPVNSLHPAGDLDRDLAALVEPVSVGYQAVVRGGVQTGDRIVVFGAGPIGLAATLAASDLGAHVLVADQIAPRLRMATSTGAERIVDTLGEDLRAAVDRFTGAEGAAVVIDATGVPEIIRQACDLVAYSGAVVVVGISDRAVSIPVIEFTKKEMSIYGSRNSTHLFDRSIELARRHQGELRSWITHRISLEELPRMLDYAMRNPADVEKMLVIPNQGS